MTYTILKTEWYLALQDGPADNDRYETEAQAKAALKKLGKDGRGICVMAQTYPIYAIRKL